MVKRGEIKSYRDLLDPKWKGKMMMRDPRVSGSGNDKFVFYYLHKDLGPEFIRALAKQDIKIMRDDQTELTWLAEGRYSILIGGSSASTLAMRERGVTNIGMVGAGQLKEGGHIVPGWAAVALFNKAPHPNAAKIYINWILSKETMTEIAKVGGYASLRLDVPTDHLEDWAVPRAGYLDLLKEEAWKAADPLTPLLKELLG